MYKKILLAYGSDARQKALLDNRYLAHWSQSSSPGGGNAVAMGFIGLEGGVDVELEERERRSTAASSTATDCAT